MGAAASDVVIVGGGIAGGSLAYALASAGIAVTVLEATREYEDRVRGESMQTWGVREAQTLGVDKVMLDAGAHVAPMWRQFAEGIGEASSVPMSMMVEGVPGTLNLRHPDACQALVDAAVSAGATVVRGVQNVKLTPGKSVSVDYDEGEIAASLVVGADGRSSGIRRQAGIELDRDEPISYIAGLLVDGLDEIPDEYDVMVSEGELFRLMFHQRDGRARLYICAGRSGQHLFAGRDGKQHFLQAWNPECYPFSELVSKGVPAGPCATHAGDDTWTATPFADGVVLVGDAAGHNDPVLGQGLSIALRDVRIVRDLILDGARKPADFAGYGKERVERMRALRLAADVMAVTQVEDADNRAARRGFFMEKMGNMDPEWFPLVAGAFAGPETVPPELIRPEILDIIRNA